MNDGLSKVLETHSKIVDEGYIKSNQLKYKRYVISNLRGGVGKSSICFNLAYEISRRESLLVADLCPQWRLA